MMRQRMAISVILGKVDDFDNVGNIHDGDDHYDDAVEVTKAAAAPKVDQRDDTKLVLSFQLPPTNVASIAATTATYPTQSLRTVGRGDGRGDTANIRVSVRGDGRGDGRISGRTTHTPADVVLEQIVGGNNRYDNEDEEEVTPDFIRRAAQPVMVTQSQQLRQLQQPQSRQQTQWQQLQIQQRHVQQQQQTQQQQTRQGQHPQTQQSQQSQSCSILDGCLLDGLAGSLISA